MEKTESRLKIVTKSRQSLLNKSNIIYIPSILSSDFDRLDCKRFAHVYHQTLSYHSVLRLGLRLFHHATINDIRDKLLLLLLLLFNYYH